MLQKILNKLKTIKLKQIIYPVMVVVLVVLIVTILISTTKFLSTAFTDAFIIQEKALVSELIRVDLPAFYPVAEKLGIEIETPSPPASPADGSAPAPIPTSTSTPEPEATPPPPEDKTALKISVLNSTNIAGLAAGLKKSLTDADFIVGNIGNYSPMQETAIIQIKESKKKEFASSTAEIQDIILRNYALGETQTLDENDPYDIVIIIGQQ